MNSNISTSNIVAISLNQNIGIISINYPPVNALSQVVRQGLMDGIETLETDSQVKAIIIRCEQRTFIAGADIKEFGKPPLQPHLPDVVNRIETCTKPVIASMFGTTLGGGFEVALACHYRVAVASAKVGLPEVNLGLIPGAGGTQRLPRVVGCNKALEMITSGKHYAVQAFKDHPLFDAIFDQDESLDQLSIKFAEQLIENSKSARTKPAKMIDDVEDWDSQLSSISKKARGKDAPVVAAELIKQTRDVSVIEGMKIERSEFVKLRDSEQSAALRYAFAVERTAAKTNFSAQPLEVIQVGIIGGGTMGSGIATAFLDSGFEVILIEQTAEALDAGVARIEKNFASNVKRGRMTSEAAEAKLSNLQASTDYQSLSHSDMVIEAVFEKMSVKKEIFSKLSSVCKDECILATNTSYLDINEIATSVERPEQVIGMHFFSPANIMKLLEVVQAEHSSEQALVTAMSVAKKLKKISVLVGVCFGFAGNRMYTRYGREVQQMLLEGASVVQVDKALTTWGMAMGPLAVADMSGIDIGVNARNSQPFPEHDPGYFRPSVLMFEQNRFGRKTGAGYYLYDQNNGATEDPLVADIIKTEAQKLNITQTTFTDEEIVQRFLLALISEGAQLLQDGIVQRLSDIDVIWLHGYGFPRHKGGPMFQAQQMGKGRLQASLEAIRVKAGEAIWPEVELDFLD
ncbi:MAG: 3-hydroxyacyl-CoA dehydrogenase NAD-binding domain-containing protein [Kangiellaceae bacterium]